ncbi:MAG: AAA family ATPase [Candidatus Beckwithbacteria bacterium]
MYLRLLRAPRRTSFFLFGPRGTGKTTWVKKNFPKALYFDLLKGETFNSLLANPSRLEEQIPKNYKDWVVIDEVQKIPELLDEVHRLIEAEKYKFILTGSSARKLRRGGVNLLAGRAVTRYFHPLTAMELSNDFKLTDYVKFGGMPSVFSAEDKMDYLKSYVKTYLDQEVVQEGISRNLGAFARFLEVASFSQGSILNMLAVAREAGVGRRMSENYFLALEDLLIGVKLPVFGKRAKRRLMNKAKFYFFDAGVYQAIRPIGPFDQSEFIGGMALETAVFQNVRAVNDYLNLGYDLFYWRTVSGLEVDLVVYGKRGIKAFEVKSRQQIDSRDLIGLKTFLTDYPEAKGYLIYGGKVKQYREGVEIWPAEEALKSLGEIL